jgi:hypothetical protein
MLDVCKIETLDKFLSYSDILIIMTPQDKHAATQEEGVDRGLVAMFLRMTPEERIVANDNSLRTIWELRDAFTQRKKQTARRRSERTA